MVKLVIYDDEYPELTEVIIKANRKNINCLTYSDATKLYQELEEGILTDFDIFLTDLEFEKVIAYENRTFRDSKIITGVDLAKKVRQLYPNRPIIIQSAYELPQKSEFHDYFFQKPFDIKETLLPALDEIIKLL